MIVDVHYHYTRLPADEEAARSSVAGMLIDAERAGIRKSVDEVLPLFRDIMEDVECDKLVQRMDESGVDVTVINLVDNYDWGATNERVMRAHERCANAAAKHPGRLIALAGIEPRRPDAPALFRECIERLGMKGLKWHPDNGFYPNSKEAYEVLQVADELGVPLLTHTGPLPSSRAKYSHPLHLDDIALDFPDMPIIAAHMGDILWRDWAALAKYKRNIFGDLAMWQFLAVNRPAHFRGYLRELLDLVGASQVLFATDGPVFEPHVSTRRFIEIVRRLPEESADGLRFTQQEVDAMLGGNAARIFKL